MRHIAVVNTYTGKTAYEGRSVMKAIAALQDGTVIAYGPFALKAAQQKAQRERELLIEYGSLYCHAQRVLAARGGRFMRAGV